MNGSTASQSPNTSYNYTSPGGNGDLKGFNPQLGDVFNTQNQNQQNFNQSQQNQASGFQDAYNAAAQALPSYQTLQNNANQQYNVQPLAQNATNLNNQLLRLPSENFGLTQGSDTNQAQLDQMTGVQQFRLQPLAQNATAQAQTAQGLANTMVNAGVNNEQQLLSPYANTASLEQGVLGSAASNFGAQQQAELQALTAKQNSGQALTQTDLNNLNNLQLAQIQGQYTIANTAQGQKFINAPQNNSIYNTQTGAAINPTNAIGSGVSYQY